MAANMPEANADYLEAMRKMNPPMMMGMAIDDLTELIGKHGK